MNQSTDLASQTARFSDAVRAFAPVSASRCAKLLPFREGIVELRQKGASYRLIRELLAIAGVSVAVDSIGQFVREVIEQVIEQRAPSRPPVRRRPVRPLSEPSGTGAVPTPSRPQFPFTLAPPVAPDAPEPPRSSPSAATAPPPTSERPRTRGPRIADPANL